MYIRAVNPPSDKGRRVLIVDDSAVVRRNLHKLLARHPGVAVLFEAHSVYSTIQQVETEHPDTIIVDLHLQDGSGFEILEYLALQKPAPLTVVLTNHADPINRERAVALGADYFFDKSFEYDHILDILDAR